MKVLIIDNYDSFVYNLAQYVGELGSHPQVFRNDKLTLKQAQALEPDRIIISPGPGNPEDEHYFGVCQAVLKTMSREYRRWASAWAIRASAQSSGGRSSAPPG